MLETLSDVVLKCDNLMYIRKVIHDEKSETKTARPSLFFRCTLCKTFCRLKITFIYSCLLHHCQVYLIIRLFSDGSKPSIIMPTAKRTTAKWPQIRFRKNYNYYYLQDKAQSWATNLS